MKHRTTGWNRWRKLAAVVAIPVVACVVACAGNRAAPATSPPADAPGAPDRRPGAETESRVTEKTPPPPPAEQAAPVRVVLRSSFASAAVGSTIELHVDIEGADGVGSAPFHLLYNPAVLEFKGAREGAFLKRDGNTTTFLVSDGRDGEGRVIVGHSILGAGTGVNGDGRLCVLSFVAVGTGDAGLAFERAYLMSGQGTEVPVSFEVVPLKIR